MMTTTRPQTKTHGFSIRKWMGALIYFLIYNIDELAYIVNIFPSPDVLWKQTTAAAGEFFWRARSIMSLLGSSLARLFRGLSPTFASSAGTKLAIVGGVLAFLVLPNYVMFFTQQIKL